MYGALQMSDDVLYHTLSVLRYSTTTGVTATAAATGGIGSAAVCVAELVYYGVQFGRGKINGKELAR